MQQQPQDPGRLAIMGGSTNSMTVPMSDEESQSERSTMMGGHPKGGRGYSDDSGKSDSVFATSHPYLQHMARAYVHSDMVYVILLGALAATELGKDSILSVRTWMWLDWALVIATFFWLLAAIWVWVANWRHQRKISASEAPQTSPFPYSHLHYPVGSVARRFAVAVVLAGFMTWFWTNGQQTPVWSTADVINWTHLMWSHIVLMLLFAQRWMGAAYCMLWDHIKARCCSAWYDF
jgi:hypothetical protein